MLMLMTVTNEYDRFYNGKVHTIVDLGMRDETADKGSVCGMAAVYQAGLQTLLTVSQIKQMSFSDVKVVLGEEMGYDKTETIKLSDYDLMSLYHDCKVTPVIL